MYMFVYFLIEKGLFHFFRFPVSLFTVMHYGRIQYRPGSSSLLGRCLRTEFLTSDHMLYDRLKRPRKLAVSPLLPRKAFSAKWVVNITLFDVMKSFLSHRANKEKLPWPVLKSVVIGANNTS